MPTLEEARVFVGKATRFSEGLLSKERVDPHSALVIRDSLGQLDHLDSLPRMMHPLISHIANEVIEGHPLETMTEQDMISVRAFARNYVYARYHLDSEEHRSGVLIGEGTGLFVAHALNRRLSRRNAGYLTLEADRSISHQQSQMRGGRILFNIDVDGELPPDLHVGNLDQQLEEAVRIAYATAEMRPQITQRFSNEIELAVDPEAREKMDELIEKIPSFVHVKYLGNVSRKSPDMRGYRTKVAQASEGMKIGIGGKYKVYTEFGESTHNSDLVQFSIANFTQGPFSTIGGQFETFLSKIGVQKVTDCITVRLPEASDGSGKRQRNLASLGKGGAAIAIAAAGVGAAAYWRKRRNT